MFLLYILHIVCVGSYVQSQESSCIVKEMGAIFILVLNNGMWKYVASILC